MIPLKASKLYIVEGVEEDPLTRERVRRLETGIHADIVEHVGDAELNRAFVSGEMNSKRHGMKADIEPVVIFSRFRFDNEYMKYFLDCLLLEAGVDLRMYR